MLVVDASVSLRLAAAKSGFRFLTEELIAPPLMWSEFRSALHELVWRGAVERSDADAALRNLEVASIASKSPKRLGETAWSIADELGLAKTYDAEYLALARLNRCKLVTEDRRLLRGAERLDLVVALEDAVGR